MLMGARGLAGAGPGGKGRELISEGRRVGTPCFEEGRTRGYFRTKEQAFAGQSRGASAEGSILQDVRSEQGLGGIGAEWKGV